MQEMCEKMYSTICNYNVDFVISNYNIISKKGIERIEYEDSFLLLNDYNEIPKNLINYYIWKCIFKREFIIKNDIEFPNYYLYEDNFFMMSSYTYMESMIFLNDFYGYNYYIHENTASHNVSLDSFWILINSMIYLDNTGSHGKFRKEVHLDSILAVTYTIFMYILLLPNLQLTDCKKILSVLKPYLKKYSLSNKSIHNHNNIRYILIVIVLKITSVNPYILFFVSKLKFVYFRFRLEK
jgi:hypothetical protein